MPARPALIRENGFCLDWSHALRGTDPAGDPAAASDEQGLIDVSAFEEMPAQISACHRGLDRIRAGEPQGDAGPVRFMHLPDPDAGVQPESDLRAIDEWAHRLKHSGDIRHVLYMGIGGSGLGPIMVHDVARGPAYNRHGLHKRKGRPTIDFIDNADPYTMEQFRTLIDFAKTMFIVCSKSGNTVETLAAFDVCRGVLAQIGVPLHGRMTVITNAGTPLWKYGESQGAAIFAMPEGIGGRWSVLCPVGLVAAAATGADFRGMLRGAQEMETVCRRPDLCSNPAYAYAALLYLARQKHGVRINAIMPYRDSLRTVAFWATQLFMESLGKAYSRPDAAGVRRAVHAGYTVLPSRGTTDQHSTGQEMMEGPADKIVTFIRVDDPGADFALSDWLVSEFPGLSYLRGRRMSDVLGAFQKGTEQALYEAGRPSVTVSLADVSERSLGQLIMFFEYAVAALAELLDVSAYDQPGVEAGKKAAHRLLEKP